MPTFYEGKPIETVEQTINAADYASAYYAAQSTVSLLHKKEVKTGICLTLAVISGCMIPLFHTVQPAVWGLIAASVALIGIAAVFFFAQPKDIRNWAEQLYRSNSLLAFAQKITIYRDSIQAESAHEQFLEYWTDFSRCVETRDAFVLVDGRERYLLAIKKEGLSRERVEAISAHLAGAFASRYQKFGR